MRDVERDRFVALLQWSQKVTTDSIVTYVREGREMVLFQCFALI